MIQRIDSHIRLTCVCSRHDGQGKQVVYSFNQIKDIFFVNCDYKRLEGQIIAYSIRFNSFDFELNYDF